MIARVPIRWRLALAFALGMALLLIASGLFLRVRLADQLQAGIEDGLRTRSDEVAAQVAATHGDRLGDVGAARISDAGEDLVQLLDPGGRVLDASPASLRGTVLVDPEHVARGRRGRVLLDAPAVPGADSAYRLLVRPVATSGGERLVVVGGSLESRDEAVSGLVPLLLLVGPVALLLASALGYAVAAAALRPVEVLRAGAAGISGAEGARLALSPADDELRDLGETLNAMLSRIDHATQRERDFVADAGHELRTPIAVLKAEIDLALAGERPAAELRAALVSAREETARLVRLSDALLDLGRADRGGTAVRASVDMRELLDAVARRFAPRAAGAGRALLVSGPAGLRGAVDRARIEDAVGNLVENALSHGAGPIRLEAAPRDGGVCLSVSDGGPGFDPAFTPVAFERFTRPDAGRSGGGAGLGLAIVRATARQHGGDAEIAEGPGGARVTIRLP